MPQSNCILITGASGLLGANLVATVLERDAGVRLIAQYNRNPIAIPGVTCLRTDLTKSEEASGLVHDSRPGWIVHCAALTNVDLCEKEPELARRTHVDASRSLARAAADTGAQFVYISTDAVYPGDGGPYREDHPTGPVNEYALTKLEGEHAVQEIVPGALIVRCNIYGWNLLDKNSLAEWILNRLETGETVPGFSDVIFSPILVNDLSDTILEMMERDCEGVYNTCGSESCSKYDFAMRLAEVFGHDPGQVQPSRMADSALTAPRPVFTPLAVEKLQRELGRPMPGIWAGLARFQSLRAQGFVRTLKSWRGEADG